jgi:hypothetical protein
MTRGQRAECGWLGRERGRERKKHHETGETRQGMSIGNGKAMRKFLSVFP